MPRKLILIPVLILLTLLVGAPPTQAITINGKEYWTLEETPEKELIENFFIITALNPYNATVRVLFNDESASRWRPWTDEKDALKELHIFWWENGPKNNYFDTTDPGLHRIYDYAAESSENIFPANQEVEISIPKEIFDILKTTPLYYFAISNLSSVVGPRDFRTCLSDIEGRENYECSVAIGKTGGITYYPTEIKKQAPTPEIIPDFKAIVSTPVAASTPETNEPKPNMTEKISTSTMRVPEKTTGLALNVGPEATSNTVSDAIASTDNVNADIADETIEVPLAASSKDHQFPWWLVIFIFSGIFLVLWWFIPVGRRKDHED